MLCQVPSKPTAQDAGVCCSPRNVWATHLLEGVDLEKEGTGGKKMGISAAAGTLNQICNFIGSMEMLPNGSIGSRWKSIGSRWKCFPNGLVLGSHGGDAGNSTSMPSGSGDGEAKLEVEESLLCWRLHGMEGFDSTS